MQDQVVPESHSVTIHVKWVDRGLVMSDFPLVDYTSIRVGSRFLQFVSYDKLCERSIRIDQIRMFSIVKKEGAPHQ